MSLQTASSRPCFHCSARSGWFRTHIPKYPKNFEYTAGFFLDERSWGRRSLAPLFCVVPRCRRCAHLHLPRLSAENHFRCSPLPSLFWRSLRLKRVLKKSLIFSCKPIDTYAFYLPFFLNQKRGKRTKLFFGCNLFWFRSDQIPSFALAKRICKMNKYRYCELSLLSADLYIAKYN